MPTWTQFLAVKAKGDSSPASAGSVARTGSRTAHAAVCGPYVDPPTGVVVWSVDEKTGMQARSRVNPTRPAQPATGPRPGRRARREFEYRRQLFFSILQRRLLRYGEVDSVGDVATKVIAFIDDHNKRATPLRWTYDGRPLQAV